MLILKAPDVECLLGSLTTEDCRSFLADLHDILQQCSAAKRDAALNDTIHQPSREVIATKDGNTSLFMPSSITTTTSIKIVTVSNSGIKGCINVFAPNGTLLGLLNAEQITAFRTSLAVMIPFVRFPHPKTNIVVFGAGNQAEWHIRLALLLCGEEVKHVTVVNRSSSRGIATLFDSLRTSYTGITFDILLKESSDYDTQLQSHLLASNAIFCCTPATVPHFPHSYLGDDRPRFISLIGSYKPSMREIDSDTLLSGGPILVDSKEDCLIEAGELIHAGVKEDELVEIGDLEAFEQAIRHSPGNLVFKCVGFAVMDLLAAQKMLALAKDKGIGLDIGDL